MAYCLTAVAGARSFGTAHKGLRLHRGVETTVFSRACAADEAPCAMQHWWSGGNFEGYGLSRVRYYADNEAAVDLPFGLAHGLAPSDMDDNGPFNAVTWRNGEPGHGGRAYAVNASSLALVYEW